MTLGSVSVSKKNMPPKASRHRYGRKQVLQESEVIIIKGMLVRFRVSFWIDVHDIGTIITHPILHDKAWKTMMSVEHILHVQTILHLHQGLD
jgi:hypothetical protein